MTEILILIILLQLNRKTKAPVFHLQDEPPNWNSDMEMGLESISEPDFDLPDEDDEFADADDHHQIDNRGQDCVEVGQMTEIRYDHPISAV